MFKKSVLALGCILGLNYANASVLSIDIEVQEKKIPVVFFNKKGLSQYNDPMFNKIQSNIFKTKKIDLIKAQSNSSCSQIAKIKKTSIYCVHLRTDINSYPENQTVIDIESVGFAGKNVYSTKVSFSNSNDNFYAASNEVSDFVYKTIFNQNSYFNSKLAYVKSVGRGKDVNYNLAVSNIDGSNEKVYLVSKAPIMSIDWSPDNSKLAYVSYEKIRSGIFIHDLNTNNRTQITNYKGINGFPSWNPNGRSIVMSLSKDGSSDIYIYELSSQKLFKVTNDKRFNETEPSWINSEEIIFTSNKTGNPNLYIYNIINKRIRKAQNQYNYVTTPKVSKDGTFTIATYKKGRQYGLIRINENGKVSLITNDYYGESPTVSGNNKLIMYSTKSKNGLNILRALDLEGNELFKVGSSVANIKEPALSN